MISVSALGHYRTADKQAFRIISFQDDYQHCEFTKVSFVLVAPECDE